MLRSLQKASVCVDEQTQEFQVYNTIFNSCLGPFMPSHSIKDFRKLLKKFGFHPPSIPDRQLLGKMKSIPSSKYDLKSENQTDESSVHLIPEVTFYENSAQADILQQISIELALGQHLLLIGNQGVGKNKVIDKFLQEANLPRQYIQLHRDVTVQSITAQQILKDGQLVLEDSRLVTAVREGQVLVIDEADKAPREVVCVLKGLIDGEMILPDGRKILSGSASKWRKMNSSSPTSVPELFTSSEIIPMHPDFRLIILANRPNWPFQGNDFYAECGELFSCHAVINPDRDSQVEILAQYGPSLDREGDWFKF
jgi:von Willebrand factor A domain-containing protein 8